MSDVIDFNEIKNKVRDKDLDDFESYIFDLYAKMGSGELDMPGLNRAVLEYMEKENLSYEKFMEIQSKLMSRYGFNMEDFTPEKAANPKEYESYRKQMGFLEKYKGKLKDFKGYHHMIKNEKNNLELFIHDKMVIISSTKNVDLDDNELNEFLVSYKKLQEDEKLHIKISENQKEYDY